jgi:hypothetical protein
LLDRLQADRSEKTSSDTPTGNLNWCDCPFFSSEKPRNWRVAWCCLGALVLSAASPSLPASAVQLRLWGAPITARARQFFRAVRGPH